MPPERPLYFLNPLLDLLLLPTLIQRAVASTSQELEQLVGTILLPLQPIPLFPIRDGFAQKVIRSLPESRKPSKRVCRRRRLPITQLIHLPLIQSRNNHSIPPTIVRVEATAAAAPNPKPSGSAGAGATLAPAAGASAAATAA